MALQQLNAPSRAQSGIPAAVPPSGVAHQRHRHTEKFTVIGNHLAQHEGMSLVALGLGVYIQSLPDGVNVGIKTLAARFEEGEVTIAKALRQLEAYGYLSRTRERTPQGRWVTRTVAYDMPPPLTQQPTAPKPRPRPKPAPTTAPAPAPAITSAPTNTLSPARTPSPAPPLPEPGHPDLTRHRTATEILAGLRRHDPRLVLSERDVRRLAGAVSAWLERGIEPAAVQHTLTSLLPHDPIHSPAALLAHRLTTLLPPPLPAAPARARVVPLQNCDRCDHAFRAPEPGNCPGCRAASRPGAGLLRR
ncbi:helix-turn-helix domain-containing protein [Streptomyces sp. NPDC088147]|uniref:helix-turn-helix domain-containing protein n=1 Tax=Streptomyces sp. NPDC088147 TaxID=3365830 RepID=UPI003805AFD1